MPRTTVDGIELAYDIVGDGSRSGLIVPRGRFSKDTWRESASGRTRRARLSSRDLGSSQLWHV